jgi:hypothetical protein
MSPSTLWTSGSFAGRGLWSWAKEATMYFVGLLIKVGSFWLASQLELARYMTELKPKLSSFKNSNEPSRAELLTSEFERV